MAIPVGFIAVVPTIIPIVSIGRPIIIVSIAVGFSIGSKIGFLLPAIINPSENGNNKIYAEQMKLLKALKELFPEVMILHGNGLSALTLDGSQRPYDD